MCRRVTLGVHTQRLVFTAILMLAAPRPGGAQGIPGGWSASDVGSVGASGASSGSGGVFTLRGGGADIWDTADGFHFLYRTMTGDGEVVTRMHNIEYVHAWSKAGVMMRGSLAPGATYAYMLASAGKGTAFQRRQYTNVVLDVRQHSKDKRCGVIPGLAEKGPGEQELARKIKK